MLTLFMLHKPTGFDARKIIDEWIISWILSIIFSTDFDNKKRWIIWYSPSINSYFLMKKIGFHYIIKNIFSSEFSRWLSEWKITRLTTNVLWSLKVFTYDLGFQLTPLLYTNQIFNITEGHFYEIQFITFMKKIIRWRSFQKMNFKGKHSNSKQFIIFEQFC